MQFIVDAFDFIINTIKSGWSFFTSLIDNLILLVKYVVKASQLAFECVLEMPSWIQVFGILTISVSILYLILGREGGKSD